MWPKSRRVEDLPYQTVLARGLEELGIKTAAHERLWQMSEAEWSADLDAGTITFSSPKGLTATAPVQVIGTYDTNQGTWLWAWDNPSIAAEVAAHSVRPREYGRRQRLADLTTRKLQIDEERCWEFAALA